MDRNWYAVYTKPGKEKKAVMALAKKKIESYCPLNNITNVHNKDQRSVPLFNSCVFVYISPSEITTVKNTSCINNFLYYKSAPAIIKRQEIELVRQVTRSFVNITLKKAVVDMSENLSISDIPLFGYESNFMTVNYGTLKITLPSLGCTLIAQKGEVKPVKAAIISGFRRIFASSLRSFMAIGI